MNNTFKVLLQRPGALCQMLSQSMQAERQSCPNCGGKSEPGTLDRRFMVMTLARCSECGLLYRSPTDAPEASVEFYQSDYTESTVTDLPTEEALRGEMESGFASKGSLTPYIDLAHRLVSSEQPRLVDYGCSWGYNTWKFGKAGFAASGVEVSRPRCDFGRDKLGIDAHYKADDLAPPFDVFFSSHVFEHVPSPSGSLGDAKRLLAGGGLAIIITPNGSQAFREVRPDRWHELWGRKHPNFLDDVFWKKELESYPHVLMSRSEDGSVKAPLDKITHELLFAKPDFNLSGEELIAVISFQDVSQQG